MKIKIAIALGVIAVLASIHLAVHHVDVLGFLRQLHGG